MVSPYTDLDRPPLSARSLTRALVTPGSLWTRLDLRAETGSTNADAAEAARRGEPEGLLARLHELGVVVVLVSVLSISEGFRATLADAGSPSRAMILRNGSDSEMTSGLTGPEVDIIKTAPGLSRASNAPMAAGELFVIIDLNKRSTGSPANEATLTDLVFAWRSCRAVKSNAIVIVADGATIGVGMGQVNRVDAARLAVERGGERVRGAVAAGVGQVVLLGAGFDCRALRLAELEAATVFEVDFPDQLASKRAVLEEAGVALPDRIRFVPKLPMTSTDKVDYQGLKSLAEGKE